MRKACNRRSWAIPSRKFSAPVEVDRQDVPNVCRIARAPIVDCNEHPTTAEGAVWVVDDQKPSLPFASGDLPGRFEEDAGERNLITRLVPVREFLGTLGRPFWRVVQKVIRNSTRHRLLSWHWGLFSVDCLRSQAEKKLGTVWVPSLILSRSRYRKPAALWLVLRPNKPPAPKAGN